MTNETIHNLNVHGIRVANTLRRLTGDELENVSGGSYYTGGWGSQPSLAKVSMTCEDRTTAAGNPYTYCYW